MRMARDAIMSWVDGHIYLPFGSNNSLLVCKIMFVLENIIDILCNSELFFHSRLVIIDHENLVLFVYLFKRIPIHNFNNIFFSLI